jgi:sulfoxide reductase heme-binding subunit YedZ
MTVLASGLAGDPKILWYLNRATGLVLLVLFTAAVLLGQASTARPGGRLPRFVSVELHRNTALLGLVMLVLHVATSVADGFVDIAPIDAVIPFRSPYRPLWLGLGTLALDLALAVALTTLVRRWLSPVLWRGVHWLSYLCWAAAVLHGLGTGTDTRQPGTLLAAFGCVAVVALGGLIRLAGAERLRLAVRLPAVLLLAALPLGVVVFLRAGPLQPDWSRRAGTPPPVTQAPGR